MSSHPYARGYLSNQHMQYMPPALREIGSMWQPRLNYVNVYHSSGVDYMKGGWRKWNSAGHWDMHSDSAAAVVPDWYKRRNETIRNGDIKMMNWHYDRYDKPTQFRAYGEITPNPKPVYNGLNWITKKPETSYGNIPTIKYGQYSPHHFEDPSRCDTLPPLHDTKHM